MEAGERHRLLRRELCRPLANAGSSRLRLRDDDQHRLHRDSEISNIQTKSGPMVRIADGGKQAKTSMTLNSESFIAECISVTEAMLRYLLKSVCFKSYVQPG